MIQFPARKKSVVVESIIAFLLLLPPFFFLYHRSAWGDSSIYFTFIKNFFSLPFSYQPHTISFGASSPLHVIVHSPIYVIFGRHWLVVGTLLNYLFIALGIVALKRAVAGNAKTLLLIVFLTLLCTQLLVDASRLYEAGLAFLALSLLYYLLRTNRYGHAALAAGVLYVVRPELILVSAAIDMYVLFRSDNRKRMIGLIALSFVPALVYHVYMFFGTGEYIPSSAYSRAIGSQEGQVPFIERLSSTLTTFRRSRELTYFLCVLVLVFALAENRIKRFAHELLILVPVGLVYLSFPPQKLTIHYLVPLTPIMVITVVRYVREILQISYSRRVIFILLLLVYGFYGKSFYGHPMYDHDTFLLKDLAGDLNKIATEKDGVLLYEIQGQYYIRAFCYSLDSVVGNHLFHVLMGRDTFENFIRKSGVKYIVTMNALNYRKIYDDTLLESIYTHDLGGSVGDTVESGGMLFRKIMTNPIFADSTKYAQREWKNLNNGDRALRVYGAWNGRWKGHHPLWNSVYEVIADRQF